MAADARLCRRWLRSGCSVACAVVALLMLAAFAHAWCDRGGHRHSARRWLHVVAVGGTPTWHAELELCGHSRT